MATALSRSSLSISNYIHLFSRRLSCPFPAVHTPSFLLPLRSLTLHPRQIPLISPFPLRIFFSSNTNNPTSFSWSDDDEEDDKSKIKQKSEKTKTLPPPYDPLSKKSLVEEPEDPTNLQEIFHKMRTDGLHNNAIKMFDALSKDGLTHEALELFSVIKDKGTMPDVIAHTAVIEAYANAGGHAKDVIRTFDRMLASGVAPNAYTYAVLIKGLARDSKLTDARKYLLEMMGTGMKPNAPTYIAVFEAYLREQQLDNVRFLLEEMRGKGFRPDEKEVSENLGKRGQVFKGITSLLFGK